MIGIGKLFSSVTDIFTERKTDKDIEILKDNVKALNYELSLLRLFEAIGYHTETQPGYVYTNINDGHGLYSLRRGLIRASNF